MAAVTVVRDEMGETHLKVNNRFQMGGTSSVFSDRRQGHIPLLLHPHPKRALFLGLGTGSTLAAAADHPGLTADGVELIPEVMATLPYFEKATGNLSLQPKLRLITADARRYVNARPGTYDVIVADLFHPARGRRGIALHPGALPGHPRPAAPRRGVLPVAAAVSTGPGYPAPDHPDLPGGLSGGDRLPGPLQSKGAHCGAGRCSFSN